MKPIGNTVRLFLTWESTWDLPNSMMKGIVCYNDEFNRLASQHPFPETPTISLLGIVFVIMNPSVAAPFPEGFIYRKYRGEVDWKKQISFCRWTKLGEHDRIKLVHIFVKELINERIRVYLPVSILSILDFICEDTLSNVIAKFK